MTDFARVPLHSFCLVFLALPLVGEGQGSLELAASLRGWPESTLITIEGDRSVWSSERSLAQGDTLAWVQSVACRGGTVVSFTSDEGNAFFSIDEAVKAEECGRQVNLGEVIPRRTHSIEGVVRNDYGEVVSFALVQADVLARVLAPGIAEVFPTLAQQSTLGTESGEFAVESAGSGTRVTLVFDHERHESAELQVDGGLKFIDASLKSARDLEGKLLSAGVRDPGETAYAVCSFFREGGSKARCGAAAIGPGGDFRLEGVPIGPFEVSVVWEDPYVRSGRWFEVAPEDDYLDIDVGERSTMEGRVVSSRDGAALPGADISVVADGGGLIAQLKGNDEGEFRVPGLEPGWIEVGAQAPGYRPKRKRVEIGSGVSVDLRLEPIEMGWLVVIVRDDGSGLAIPDSEVRVRRVRDGNTTFATADDYGRLRLSLEAGEYQLTATRFGSSSQVSITVVANQTREVEVVG